MTPPFALLSLTPRRKARFNCYICHLIQTSLSRTRLFTWQMDKNSDALSSRRMALYYTSLWATELSLTLTMCKGVNSSSKSAAERLRQSSTAQAQTANILHAAQTERLSIYSTSQMKSQHLRSWTIRLSHQTHRSRAAWKRLKALKMLIRHKRSQSRTLRANSTSCPALCLITERNFPSANLPAQTIQLNKCATLTRTNWFFWPTKETVILARSMAWTLKSTQVLLFYEESASWKEWV